VRLALALLALLCTGCGVDWRTERPTARAITDRGFSAELPPGWFRATGPITPHITEPREILTVATVPIAGADPRGICDPRSRPALPEFTATDALVTIQESGRGALRLNRLSHPPRPDRFRPDDFEDGSMFTDCFVGDLPVDDHWFGFSDAGRAFHVLVIVGRDARDDVRDEAWAILDRLRFDPRVRPRWKATT
jgi:hypothetical protein